VQHLHLALFAFRQIPNWATGLSSYQLVYGNNVCTPLDNIYEGWRSISIRKLDVYKLAEELCEHLEILRDVARSNGLVKSSRTKKAYDKSTAKCEFLRIATIVLCIIFGMIG